MMKDEKDHLETGRGEWVKGSKECPLASQSRDFTGYVQTKSVSFKM